MDFGGFVKGSLEDYASVAASATAERLIKECCSIQIPTDLELPRELQRHWYVQKLK